MSKLETLNQYEILVLDRKLRQCAQLAMNPYLDIDINSRKKPELETEELHQLLKDIESYKEAFADYYKMRFPIRSKKDGELRTEVVGDNINALFIQLEKEELSRQEMGIFFPIAIYVLIMNNCFNKYAIEGEEQRIKNELKERNKKIRKHNRRFKERTIKEFSYEDVFRDMFRFSAKTSAP